MTALRQAEVSTKDGNELKLLGIRANGTLKGRLLAMSLEQRFRNPGDMNIEITYTFPLPWGAVLMGVDVELNGMQLKGEVIPKTIARAKYEEALSEGNSSIMLEKNADHSYTLELGNLLAHEECNITVRYVQILQLEHGQVRLMLPTTIAPRYGNPLMQGQLQPHQTSEPDLTVEYPFEISVTLYGDLAKANVSSPSHKTGYVPGDDQLLVWLAQRGCLDRDFILTISKLENQSVGISCQDNLIEGQKAVMASFCPSFPSQALNPVSVKILVDCSGSMAGDSIQAARISLARIVQGLEKSDKFSLTRFGTTVEHRSRIMWSGTPQAKTSANRWMESLLADMGGTEMADALLSTISIQLVDKSDILLITDGEIEGINQVIEIATLRCHRVFVVAIGASPAEAHLRRLAQATGGACDFVAPGEDVEPAVLRMFSRLRSLRMNSLRVEWPSMWDVKWEQQAPTQIFNNDAVNFFAFIANSDLEAKSVKLWGRVDGLENERLLAEAVVTPIESTVNTLARMTGYSQYLELALSTTSEQMLSKDAQALAVSYQLVTDETNFILVHERAASEKPDEMPDAHKVPHMLAAGWGGSGSIRNSYPALDVQRGVTNDVSFSAPSQTNETKVRPLMYIPSTQSTPASEIAHDNDVQPHYSVPLYLRKQADAGSQITTVRRDIDRYNKQFWIQQVPEFLLQMDATEWESYYQSPFIDMGNYFGITPAGFEAWLFINDANLWPKKYSGLRKIGIGISICEWLEFEIGFGKKEAEVVRTFAAVMLEFKFEPVQGLNQTIQTIEINISTTNIESIDEHIADAIRKGLQGIEAVRWPDRLVSFPELV